MLGKAGPSLEGCDPSHSEMDRFLLVATRESLQLAPQGRDHRGQEGFEKHVLNLSCCQDPGGASTKFWESLMNANINNRVRAVIH